MADNEDVKSSHQTPGVNPEDQHSTEHGESLDQIQLTMLAEPAQDSPKLVPRQPSSDHLFFKECQNSDQFHLHDDDHTEEMEDWHLHEADKTHATSLPLDVDQDFQRFREEANEELSSKTDYRIRDENFPSSTNSGRGDEAEEMEHDVTGSRNDFEEVGAAGGESHSPVRGQSLNPFSAADRLWEEQYDGADEFQNQTIGQSQRYDFLGGNVPECDAECEDDSLSQDLMDVGGKAAGRDQLLYREQHPALADTAGLAFTDQTEEMICQEKLTGTAVEADESYGGYGLEQGEIGMDNERKQPHGKLGNHKYELLDNDDEDDDVDIQMEPVEIVHHSQDATSVAELTDGFQNAREDGLMDTTPMIICHAPPLEQDEAFYPFSAQPTECDHDKETEVFTEYRENDKVSETEAEIEDSLVTDYQQSGVCRDPYLVTDTPHVLVDSEEDDDDQINDDRISQAADNQDLSSQYASDSVTRPENPVPPTGDIAGLLEDSEPPSEHYMAESDSDDEQEYDRKSCTSENQDYTVPHAPDTAPNIPDTVQLPGHVIPERANTAPYLQEITSTYTDTDHYPEETLSHHADNVLYPEETILQQADSGLYLEEATSQCAGNDLYPEDSHHADVVYSAETTSKQAEKVLNSEETTSHLEDHYPIKTASQQAESVFYPEKATSQLVENAFYPAETTSHEADTVSYPEETTCHQADTVLYTAEKTSEPGDDVLYSRDTTSHEADNEFVQEETLLYQRDTTSYIEETVHQPINIVAPPELSVIHQEDSFTHRNDPDINDTTFMSQRDIAEGAFNTLSTSNKDEYNDDVEEEENVIVGTEQGDVGCSVGVRIGLYGQETNIDQSKFTSEEKDTVRETEEHVELRNISNSQREGENTFNEKITDDDSSDNHYDTVLKNVEEKKFEVFHEEAHFKENDFGIDAKLDEKRNFENQEHFDSQNCDMEDEFRQQAYEDKEENATITESGTGLEKIHSDEKVLITYEDNRDAYQEEHVHSVEMKEERKTENTDVENDFYPPAGSQKYQDFETTKVNNAFDNFGLSDGNPNISYVEPKTKHEEKEDTSERNETEYSHEIHQQHLFKDEGNTRLDEDVSGDHNRDIVFQQQLPEDNIDSYQEQIRNEYLQHTDEIQADEEAKDYETISEDTRDYEIFSEDTGDNEIIREDTRDHKVINEDTRDYKIISEDTRDSEITSEDTSDHEIPNEDAKDHDIINEDTRENELISEEDNAQVGGFLQHSQQDEETAGSLDDNATEYYQETQQWQAEQSEEVALETIEDATCLKGDVPKEGTHHQEIVSPGDYYQKPNLETHKTSDLPKDEHLMETEEFSINCQNEFHEEVIPGTNFTNNETFEDQPKEREEKHAERPSDFTNFQQVLHKEEEEFTPETYGDSEMEEDSRNFEKSHVSYVGSDVLTSEYEDRSYVDNLSELTSPETIPQPLPSPPEPKDLSPFEPSASTDSPAPCQEATESHLEEPIPALHQTQVLSHDSDAADFLTVGEVVGETRFSVDGTAITSTAQNNGVLHSDEDMNDEEDEDDGSQNLELGLTTTGTTETENSTDDRSGEMGGQEQPGGSEAALMSMSMEGSFYDDGGDLMGGEDRRGQQQTLLYEDGYITEESSQQDSYDPKQESFMARADQMGHKVLGELNHQTQSSPVPVLEEDRKDRSEEEDLSPLMSSSRPTVVSGGKEVQTGGFDLLSDTSAAGTHQSFDLASTFVDHPVKDSELPGQEVKPKQEDSVKSAHTDISVTEKPSVAVSGSEKPGSEVSNIVVPISTKPEAVGAASNTAKATTSGKKTSTNSSDKATAPTAAATPKPRKDTKESKPAAGKPTTPKTTEVTATASKPTPRKSTEPRSVSAAPHDRKTSSKRATSPCKSPSTPTAPAKSNTPLPSYAQPIVHRQPREVKTPQGEEKKRKKPRAASATPLSHKSPPVSTATTTVVTQTTRAVTSASGPVTISSRIIELARPKSSPVKLTNGTASSPTESKPTAKKHGSETKNGHGHKLDSTHKSSVTPTTGTKPHAKPPPAAHALPSPKSEAKSKIGSLDNTTYVPGGGQQVKITNKKPDYTNVSSKIGSKDNMDYKPGGGKVKIEHKKLKVEAKSKIGSLENATHKPGGGDKKAEKTDVTENGVADKPACVNGSDHQTAVLANGTASNI